MTIVYTSILGGSDSLKPAPVGADRCVCFVDDPTAYPDVHGWELVAHAYDGDPRREAWRLRCVPHQLFDTYDRVVWIDASFALTDLPRLIKDASDSPVAALRHHARSTITAEAVELVKVGQARKDDVDAQLRHYASLAYQSRCLSISCVIVRDHSQLAASFGRAWLAQIERFPGDNTQLSLDFSAWTTGFQIAALTGTRHTNPYAVHDGRDHKRRRRPYQVPA